MQRKEIRKRIRIAAAVCCIMAIGAGYTMAYFTDQEQVINRFTTGDPDVGLEEPEWDPEDGDGVDMYPGYTVYKNPTIKNITTGQEENGDVYARMIIYIRDAEGELIDDEEAAGLILTTIRYDDTYTGTYDETGYAETLIQGNVPGYSLSMLEDIPTVNPLFELDEERSEFNKLVYNYIGTDQNGIFGMGEEAALFTHIVIPTDWNRTQMQLVGDFVLDVVEESIQAAGFAGMEDAFGALDEICSNTDS